MYPEGQKKDGWWSEKKGGSLPNYLCDYGVVGRMGKYWDDIRFMAVKMW